MDGAVFPFNSLVEHVSSVLVRVVSSAYITNLNFSLDKLHELKLYYKLIHIRLPVYLHFAHAPDVNAEPKFARNVFDYVKYFMRF